MVQINGEDFPIYDLDTMESILSRIALRLNTIPKYLYFPKGVATNQDLINDQDISVVDLLEEIKGIAEGTLEFSNLYDIIAPKLEQTKLNLRSEVLLPFIIYSGKGGILGYPETGNFRAFAYTQIQEEIKQSKMFDPPIPDVEEIWSEREKTKKSIDELIKRNRDTSRKQMDVMNKFERIRKGIKHTKFELQKVTFDITLNLINMSLLEIFNHIKLNTNVPFATGKNFYKILKDFVPPPDWSISLDEGIIFKVLEKVNTTNVKMEDFRDALVVVEGEPGLETVTASLDLNTSGNNVSRDEFIERFLSSISDLGNISIRKSQETKVNGVFYFPQQSLNKYVFADMVMINPLFSSMLSIDEREKSTKKKTSVYVYFDLPRIGKLSAYITEKIVERNDPNLKGKDKDLFPLQSKYIMVTVSKSETLQAVKAFQNILSRLFIIYNEEYDGIVAFYKRFIPDFAKPEPIPPPVSVKIGLRQLDEIYPANYSRICRQQPTLIEDSEIEEAKKKGKEVMIFPKTIEEGSPPRAYICSDPKFPKHIYPGLRSNPFGNNEQFPYLPCCYTKNQKNVPKYRHYFHGENLPMRRGKQQDLYTTNKFVPTNAFGTLPKDINRLLEIIDSNDKYTYNRKGVNRNKSSFLSCVVEAMDEATNGDLGFINLENPMDRDHYVEQNRLDIAEDDSWASACRQEMYDFTIPEILEAIRNPDVYLDPKLFVHLLEVYYKCNIFIFTRKHLNGEMILPRHLQAYYKQKNNYPCVFILEHMGSESDHAKYPQCELIVKWKIGVAEDVKYSFSYNSLVSKGVRSVFNELNKSYALSEVIPEIEFPWKKDIKMINQSIDSYGKTRMLQVEYDGELITMITSPLQPFNVPETRYKEIIKVDTELALDLLTELKADIVGQTVIKGTVKEIRAVLGNVNIYIPIDNGDVLEDLQEFNEPVNYANNEISVIEEYNQSKKISRYIVEYMFWLYSRFLNEGVKVREANQESILEFRNKVMKIDKYFRYGLIPKTFSTKSGLMYNGKLIVKSEEILKRLMYVLQLAIIRSENKIINYHTRTMIEQYYVDITDFNQYNFQVVLEGDMSVEKWIEEKKISYRLHNSVVPTTSSPYFFKNNLISEEVFLAQNTDSPGKAIEIAVMWNQENGFNVGTEAEELDDFPFTLYAYVHSRNIKPYTIRGEGEDYDIKILGYKIGEDEFYTTLLSLT